MSDIIVHEEQILKAEECRVTLRNNLRNLGIKCADNETMDSLVKKVSTIQGYSSVFNSSLINEIIDNNIISMNSIYLQNNAGITSIYFKNLTTISSSGVSGCKSLQYLILPKLSTTNNATSNTQALKLFDSGIVQNMNTLSSTGTRENFEYLILRKTDNITTLDNTNKFDRSKFINGGGKVFVPNSLISNYQVANVWNNLSGATFLALENSRFKDLDWYEYLNSTCILDGNEKRILDNETVEIFKHTENIAHVYENGVELSNSDLVAGKTLTSTI